MASVSYLRCPVCGSSTVTLPRLALRFRDPFDERASVASRSSVPDWRTAS
jgi:hypothetical protein